ncbi:hypothetical protein BKA70DRAFT_1424940 [Coprinopsis sp. MPI-PUGE-AT-0042]|nr:hypothetical protein BKA70DRAFT_1424940 [Coprinopsis sp. MPI-PUGE-AT-0042]
MPTSTPTEHSAAQLASPPPSPLRDLPAVAPQAAARYDFVSLLLAMVGKAAAEGLNAESAQHLGNKDCLSNAKQLLEQYVGLHPHLAATPELQGFPPSPSGDNHQPSQTESSSKPNPMGPSPTPEYAAGTSAKPQPHPNVAAFCNVGYVNANGSIVTTGQNITFGNAPTIQSTSPAQAASVRVPA